MTGHDDVELTPLEQMLFAKTILENAKRIVFCSPELESRIKGYIDARGCGGVFRVEVIAHLNDDQVFIVDEAAIEAESRAWLQSLVKKPIRIYPPDDEGPPRFAGYF